MCFVFLFGQFCWQEHTQNGLTLCGGKEDLLACSSLTPEGVWSQTHDLIKERKQHTSWEMEEGILLMGGGLHQDDTELGELKLICRRINPMLVLVKSDGTTEESFSLKYSSR